MKNIKRGDTVRIKSNGKEGIGEVMDINEKSSYKYSVYHSEESDFRGRWSHKKKIVYPVHSKECNSGLVYSESKGWVCPFCELE